MLPAVQGLSPDGADLHVVASGDPLLHGIGSTLIRLFGHNNVTVFAARVRGDVGVRPDGLERV